MQSVTHDPYNNTSTVVTKDSTNVIRTYIFTYGVALTKEEEDALRKDGLIYDFRDLTKTTWKVFVTSDSKVVKESVTTTGSLKGTVEEAPNGDDAYIYTPSNGDPILLSRTSEDGKYSFTTKDGKTTYILTVNKNSTPTSVDEDALKDLIASCNILPLGYEFQGIIGNTAIYKKGNDTIRVTFDNVADKFSLETFDSESITQYFRTAQSKLDYDAKAHAQNREDLIEFLKYYQHEDTRLYTNPHIAVMAQFDLAPITADQDTNEFAGRGFLLPGFSVSLYKDAEALVDKNAFLEYRLDKLDKLAYDNSNRLFYQSTQDVKATDLQDANFYKVTGTVAYDFFSDELKGVLFFSSEDFAKKYIDDNHLDYVTVRMPDTEQWYLCKTADLTFSGSSAYLDSFSPGSYSIDFGKLFMSKEKIEHTVATPATPLGHVVRSTLSLKNFNSTVEGSGSDINGSYQVTSTKDAVSLKGEDDKWLYTGQGFSWYDTYQTWVETSSEKQNVATHEQYTGNLNYTYVENTTDVKVDASVEKDRDVQVKLDQTSVTTVPGEDTNTSTTPAPSNPGGSSSSGGSSGGSGSSSRPSSRPSSNPSTPANPSTPTDPSVNIPEEDVPLTNLPNEDVPLTSLPEEVPTELPEEDVPLAETPVLDREVSAASTRIADAQAPLADVPETGDPMLMEAFAAVAAGANALWFTMGKKRRDDTD